MPKKRVIKKLLPDKQQNDGNMEKLIKDLKKITKANNSKKTRAQKA